MLHYTFYWTKRVGAPATVTAAVMLANQKYKSTIRKHSDDDEQNRNFHCNGLGFKLEKLKFSLAQRISRIFLSFLRLALRFSTITKSYYTLRNLNSAFFSCVFILELKV